MDEDDAMDEDDPELDCPFSGSLGSWENIFAGELDPHRTQGNKSWSSPSTVF